MKVGDAVRRLGRDELERLVRLRPDLGRARDVDDLIHRANWQGSIVAATEELSMTGWVTMSAACLAGPAASFEGIRKLVSLPEEVLVEGASELAALLLADTDGETLDLHGTLRQQLPYPFGLGRPVVTLLESLVMDDLRTILAALGLDEEGRKADLVERLSGYLLAPGRIAQLVAGAPPEVRALLAEFDQRGYPCVDAEHPAEQDARAHGLLVRPRWSEAELPREVGVALRGGLPLGIPYERPAAVVRPVSDAEIAAANADAVAAAHTTIDRIARIVSLLAEEPVPLRQDEALGVREVKRLAGALGRPEHEIAWLVEVASGLGLLKRAGRAGSRRLASAGQWGGSATDRWLELARGFGTTYRHTHVAGRRDDSRLLLAPLAHAPSLGDPRPLRTDVLQIFDVLDASSALDPASIGPLAHWLRPARWGSQPASPREIAAFLHDEMESLGLVAGGRLSAPFQALRAGDEDRARELFEGAAGLGHRGFTVQADATIIVPGRAAPQTSAKLRRFADVESDGAALVLRVTETSIRRAIDAGETAEGIVAFLTEHASHGLPQPIAVLIDDVGRRHGSLVVGAGRAFVRSDDPALLEQVLRHRKLAKLGLRRAASGLLVADATTATLIGALRGAGFLPVAETPAEPAAVRARRAPPADPAFSHYVLDEVPVDPAAWALRMLASAR